ncbi:hypothetical protein [Alkalibacillus haloalkaliphilus]|uniref:hypothetical protein n=1 Tax=Alkalibacillus haloalkaliphilus TaxID=94136 RepID=UPI00031BBD6F|nr:hypothetical protein [Alkalibacillus haloalkaliphilus]
MANKLIVSSVVAAGAALTSYVLIDENRRNGIKQKVKQLKESFNEGNHTNLPIEEAGNPELDDIENSEMVAEGSQFGVQYYNEVMEKK